MLFNKSMRIKEEIIELKKTTKRVAETEDKRRSNKLECNTISRDNYLLHMKAVTMVTYMKHTQSMYRWT